MQHNIRIRNRRKRYLEAHPSYFDASLESADPLLYDRLIRKHQTESERTSERQKKGYALTLESDLLRAEAKLAEVKNRQAPSTVGSSVNHHSDTSHINTTNGNGVASRRDNRPDADIDQVPTRAEAHDQWRETMGSRFVAGEDPDFDYSVVDEDERWDDVRAEERELEEEWFDREEAMFMGSDDDGSGGDVDERKEGKGRKLEGETGIQDF